MNAPTTSAVCSETAAESKQGCRRKGRPRHRNRKGQAFVEPPCPAMAPVPTPMIPTPEGSPPMGPPPMGPVGSLLGEPFPGFTSGMMPPAGAGPMQWGPTAFGAHPGFMGPPGAHTYGFSEMAGPPPFRPTENFMHPGQISHDVPLPASPSGPGPRYLDGRSHAKRGPMPPPRAPPSRVQRLHQVQPDMGPPMMPEMHTGGFGPMPFWPRPAMPPAAGYWH